MSSVIVDDTDLSQLAYTSPPSWVREGAPPEYNSTTHGTGRVGSTVTFTFSGTSVGVFGSVSQSTSTKNLTTVSTYQVDGASTVTYTAPVSLTSHLTHQQFFQSATLQDGQHSLLITVTQADDSAKYWLDYLVYTPGSSAPSSSSSDPAASTSLSPDSSGTSHSGVNGGIIAAAVLVSVSAILLLFVSALWWRKRRARSQALARGQFEVEALTPPSSLPDQSPTTMSAVTPYMSYTAPPSYAEPAPSYSPPSTVAAESSPPSTRVAPRRGKAAMYRIAGS